MSRLPGRKADLCELCQKVPSAPSWRHPGWAERKRAGHPPPGTSTGSSVGWARGCCRALLLVPTLPPTHFPFFLFQATAPRFPLGDPLSPLSLHDCRHLYVASGAPNPGIQGLLQGWTRAHASSIEFTQNLYWSYWERGFLGR